MYPMLQAYASTASTVKTPCAPVGDLIGVHVEDAELAKVGAGEELVARLEAQFSD